MKGIEAAKAAGLEVKVNMVVKKGMNDSQILPMARYFKEQGIQLSFIEFMDVGSTNGWNFEQVITKEQLMRKLIVYIRLSLLNLITLEKLRNCIDM